MAGHVFKIVHVHHKTGEVDVMWDGDPTKVITCRVPTDDAGNLLDDAAFKKAILDQSADRLEHWDRIATLKLDQVHAKIGVVFDVTEEFIMRNNPEDSFGDAEAAGEFNFEAALQ